MIDEKTVESLKAQHGSRLELIEIDDELDIVAKPPGDGEWERFTAMVSDDDQRPKAMKTLVMACVVYPARDELRALIKERPALVGSIGKQLHEMAGAAKAVQRRKL